MKKLFTLFVAVLASIGMMNAASGKCGNNLSWTLADSTFIIEGVGNMWNYHYYADGQYVDSVPWDKQGFHTLIIPEGLRNIDADAFVESANLKTMYWNATGYGQAYMDDRNKFSYLETIVFGETVDTIPGLICYRCENLKTVTISGGVQQIGESAFAECANLQSINVAENNSKYSSIDGALFNKDKTILIICPNGRIGDYIIPDGITTIASMAFQYGSRVTSITMPSSMTNIESLGIYDCSKLNSITSNAVTSPVWDFLFTSFNPEMPIYVPAESVETYKAANGWKEFTNILPIEGEVTVGSSCDNPIIVEDDVYQSGYTMNPQGTKWYRVTNIPDIRNQNLGLTIGVKNTSMKSSNISLYYDCNQSAPFRQAELNPAWEWKIYLSQEDYNQLFASGAPSLLIECTAESTCLLEFEITDHCYVASGTCGDNLTWELSCDSVLTISGTGAMADYSYQDIPWSKHYDVIKQIIVSDGVTTIGKAAFIGCTSAETITLGKDITYIGEGAMYIQLGKLTTITCNAATPPTLGGDKTLSGYDNIYVPCPSLEAYKTADFWARHANFIHAIEGTCNEPCLLASGTCGNSITWELSCEGVLTISGNGEMPNWSSPQNGPWYEYREDITSIFIGNSVTSIGEGAFYECSGLTSVTIPSSVTSIGRVAFYYCSSLTSVTIPNSVTSIEYEAFSWCTGLMSVTIPNRVTTIGEGAFYNCSGLTSVTIPYSVTRIGSLAFYNCSGLMSVTIPNSVTTIGEFAFANCSGLTCVTCEAVTPPTLGERYDTFYGVNKTIPLYVPGPSIDLYKAADQWKDFMNILPIPGTEVVEYPVIFLDYNSDVLSEQSVEEGNAAVAPEVPEREGYIFKGWNVDIEHIVARTFAIALYDKVGVEVTYKAEDGETIFSEHADLHFPDAPSITGKTFAGWLTENIDKNGIVLRATYTVDNPTTNDDVAVVPGSNSANVTFPFVTGAITYVLVIRDLFGRVVCKIMFNASGRLLGIDFAPSRERSQTSAQTDNFQFTVEGLDPSTTYEYEFIAHDETDEVIETLSGSFTTMAEIPTDFESVQPSEISIQKVVMNDQVLILRGDRTYTVTGQEVK